MAVPHICNQAQQHCLQHPTLAQLQSACEATLDWRSCASAHCSTALPGQSQIGRYNERPPPALPSATQRQSHLLQLCLEVISGPLSSPYVVIGAFQLLNEVIKPADVAIRLNKQI